MAKKLKTFRVFTNYSGGYVYVVKAKSAKDAEENLYDLEQIDDYEDGNWCGDSQEEVYKVEEIKTK